MTSHSSTSRALLPCGRPKPTAQKPASHGTPKDWLSRLEAYVQKKGLRHSDQRVQIVDLLAGENRHFSIQELVSKVRSRYPSIGAATVYRNMKLLEEAGILKETLIDDGRQQVYEVGDSADEHHDHIVCLDCDSIFEFHDPKIEELQESATKKMGFKSERHRHVIYARCERLKRPKV